MTPNRIFFVLIESDIYEPSQKNNPYIFGLSNKNHVTDFQVTISGNELDNLNSGNYKEMNYFRFQRFLGMMNAGQTNSISRKKFFKGSTIHIADFSTSLDSSEDYIIPSLKTGYVRLRIKFKAATTQALHLLCMSEYNSTLTIESGKGGRVIKVNLHNAYILLKLI